MPVFRLTVAFCVVVVVSLLLVVSTVVVSSESETEDAPAKAHDRASQQEDRSEKPSAVDARIAHGKYLVHHVAQCIQCHTPRDEGGALVKSKLLNGAPIPVAGPRYAPPWAAESAWIAGLGSYDEAFVHYLLTHGHKPDGSRPKSPMPSFKMTDADAAAVIAYLRSL